MCDVYLGEAVAPRAVVCRAFQLSHMWALLFALCDPSAPWSGLGSNPGGTGDTELLLLGGDPSWHPWCKGTQSTALKGKVLLKGCQALLDNMPLLTAGFFLLCVWGLPTCVSSQTEVAPLVCACWTRAVLWPLPGRWLYLIELVDSITDTNNIKYIFFSKGKVLWIFRWVFFSSPASLISAVTVKVDEQCWRCADINIANCQIPASALLNSRLHDYGVSFLHLCSCRHFPGLSSVIQTLKELCCFLLHFNI